MPEREAMTDWIDDWIWLTSACSDEGRRFPSRGVTASKTDERMVFGRMPTNCERRTRYQVLSPD